MRATQRTTARQPRPSRDRGSARRDTKAYQRAMADLRDAYRDDFERLYAFHKARLQEEVSS